MPVIIKLLFNENHVGVELENGENFRLPYDVYTQYRLSSGLDLTGDLYSEIHDEARRFECRSRGISYLVLRARSIDEMKKYLRKKKFSDPEIDQTIEFLKGKGYLNDYEFAVLYTRDRMKSGNRGKDLIVRDLYRKGIGRKDIDRAISECGAGNADIEAVYKLALKKYEAVKHKNNPAVRVSNYLRQRGFGYDIIKVILERLGEEVDY